MRIDTSNWGTFLVGDFFDIHPTKAYKDISNKELNDGGEVPFVVNSSVNNGIGGFSTKPPTEKGNIITFSDTTEGNTFFYQANDFIGFAHVQGMYAKNHEWTQNQLLFLVTLLTHACYGRYSYGRKMTREKISNTEIELPIKRDGTPDWSWMEQFISSLHSKPMTTGNKKGLSPELLVQSWGEFTVDELFDVVYGVNLDYNKCNETTGDDPNGIAFVSRTESNNGVSGYVKPITGIEPQPKNTITVAGGGSVLSTFLQTRDFYSGRDLYLLIPNEEISTKAKLFITTVLKANKYRYNYGRQANVTLPHLRLMLPITKDNNPDWLWMENYIQSIPFGDRV